jgi:hypothetical protein
MVNERVSLTDWQIKNTLNAILNTFVHKAILNPKYICITAYALQVFNLS